MAEDNVIIDETSELQGIAEKIWYIANNMESTIQAAIQRGYDAAANNIFGLYGTLEINVALLQTSGVEFKLDGIEVRDNDMIIFSPETPKDRDIINRTGLFISPIIEFEDSDGSKCAKVNIQCKGTADEKEKTSIKLVYLVIRGPINRGGA